MPLPQKIEILASTILGTEDCKFICPFANAATDNLN